MVSVIIPSYNNLPLFKNALHSVLKQKGVSYEVIVVDDSNNLEIESYINLLDNDRIKYYHNIPSKGAVNNWNYGLEKSTGEKCIVLHHDESFINDNYLQRVDLLLDKYDMTIFNKRVVSSRDIRNERIPAWIKKAILFFKYPLFLVNCIGPCSCVGMNRKVLVDFDARLRWKVDSDWYFRLLKRSQRYYYCEDVEILSLHGHKDQITSSICVPKVAAEDATVIRGKYHSIIVNFFLLLSDIYYKFQ